MRTLVLNLNLAVDKTAVLPRLKAGQIYRFTETITAAGGKGVNVARALRAWGAPCRLAGFISGLNGNWIRRALAAEGIDSELFPHANGESRVCFSVIDASGTPTDFNEEGPPVPAGARAAFKRRFPALAAGHPVTAVCGRVSAGLPRGFYSWLTRTALARGSFTILDACGWPLAEALKAGTSAVKINREEFEEVSGARLSAASADAFRRKWGPAGLKVLIVTDRQNPAFAASEFGLWRLSPPALRGLKSPVGAGDSFTAGFIAGFSEGRDFEDTLRLAAGFAASDCLSLAAGVIDRRQAEEFSRRAAVARIG